MYQKKDAVDIMGDWNENNKKIDAALQSLKGTTSGVKNEMATVQAEITTMTEENVTLKNDITLSQGKLLAVMPALNVLTQVASGAEAKAANAVADIDNSKELVTAAQEAVKIANDANSANAGKITPLQERIAALENA
jgi:chromosome segregation ATPase